MLYGDFETSYTAADNSKVLPTDTMKNTVYFVARNSKAETIEAFAMEYGDYLLNNNPQVSKVRVEVDEKSWKRMIAGGPPEATTFQMGGPEPTDRLRCPRKRRRVEINFSGASMDSPSSKRQNLPSPGCDQRQTDYAQADDRSYLWHTAQPSSGIDAKTASPDYSGGRRVRVLS